MAYDQQKDPFAGDRSLAPSGSGKAIDYSAADVDLDPYPLAVVVIKTGDLVVVPAKNADADTVTITAAPVGFITPWRVRKVIKTGSTAELATIDA
jgi:hypothetical protein